ncbi:diaminopimelate epimerase [Clostridium tetanomorphum]|uniref:Diaminopimelate epimerase n=1 Tax=Clostridium tetanomorphum TaxID=1553 RepID=A0A923J0C6_CLOTT|nr:diaminopimelate epimerase [Clostridium tetanomorphum]KAJ53419.1 diaminopimelate epimerase [Clostridium tetanomorphum DSM 665]MBC2396595.1 diaminopimelate epimerase [Clostridium tetanomorphum]MBP1863923.1 diaminopimelate epimerase [Clostridium tetanomorphum]NRS85001.1 diaminopimelate epimerase [Clostridium tetanomorphum]NRZ98217.1 diaminopimelate epimerase [Clostridium tetanomorphum]
MYFTKMQGNGNDFIVVEDFNNLYLGKEKELGIKLCNRHFGIGGDGILLVRNSDIAAVKMIIINADGSYASMCGNGIRCFAKYVYEKGIAKEEKIKIETGDGVKEAFLEVEDTIVKNITINMGIPSFHPIDIPCNSTEEVMEKSIEIGNKKYKITSMLMGVPHTVIFGNLDDFDILEGSAIEKYEIFPQGTNVNFCEVINKEKIRVKTWERGAGATLACGTGSCASVIAANKINLINSKAEVELPGGVLYIEITDAGILMTGPAEIVFTGNIDI